MSDHFGAEGVIIPDLPEPITAYRAWGVYGMGTELAPLIRGFGATAWPVGAPLEAECFGLSSGLHYESCDNVPSATNDGHKGHGCGIYGYKTLDDLRSGCRLEPPIVWGEVLLWGRVMEHAHGWRAQFGQIAAIYTDPDPERARWLASETGLPLRVMAEVVHG